MSKNVVIKDVFGTPINVGNVILISKGTRGHRDFEMGIVVNINYGSNFGPSRNGSKIWIETNSGYKYKSAFQLCKYRHLADKEINDNIFVADDNFLSQKERVGPARSGLVETTKELIKNGTFPSDYVLGMTIKKEEEEEDKGSEEPAKVIVDSSEDKGDLDILSKLGMPTSLKG